MKIVNIVGARPQFIKMASVSRAIAKYQGIKEIIIHTGQHFDKNMSEVFFNELEISEPHYHLEINSLSHGAMTGRMMEKIEQVLLNEKPDCVIVYGDTNSTIAGALAAKKLHIKVAHVEAGLRSFNMQMPEEINRILTDRISDILCCPTDKAIENLKAEGFEQFACKIVKTGDVMLDAVLYYKEISSMKSNIIKRLNLDEEFLVCTVHRAENTDSPERLRNIIDALSELAREINIVLPLHPRTAKFIKDNGIKMEFKPVEPIGYLDMIELLKRTKVVLTDSGGLQKEAYFLRKPCVTLRDETEWVELVENGANMLAGTETQSIINAYGAMKDRKIDFDPELYGDGTAADRIMRNVLDYGLSI